MMVIDYLCFVGNASFWLRGTINECAIFSETFPRGSRNEVKVLDVGAGTGMVARGLRAEGFRHIDAVDASEAMLSVARRDNLYDNYYCEIFSR